MGQWNRARKDKNWFFEKNHIAQCWPIEKIATSPSWIIQLQSCSCAGQGQMTSAGLQRNACRG